MSLNIPCNVSNPFSILNSTTRPDFVTTLYILLSTKKKTYKISGGQTGNTYQNCKAQEFPGGPVVGTPRFAFTAEGVGSIPGRGPGIPASRMARPKKKKKCKAQSFYPINSTTKNLFYRYACCMWLVFFISSRKKRQLYSY